MLDHSLQTRREHCLALGVASLTSFLPETAVAEPKDEFCVDVITVGSIPGICSLLIDWSLIRHPYPYNAQVPLKHALRLKSPAVQRAAWEFLHYMERTPTQLGKPIRPIPKEACMRLKALLLESPDGYRDYFFPMPPQFTRQQVLYEEPIQYNIQQLKNFALHYRSEPYLSGYARLYATILHLIYFEPKPSVLSKVQQDLVEIQKDYKSFTPIALMAAWWQAIAFKCYEMPDRTTQALEQFVRTYRTEDWWVVSLAQAYLKSPSGVELLNPDYRLR